MEEIFFFPNPALNSKYFLPVGFGKRKIIPPTGIEYGRKQISYSNRAKPKTLASTAGRG